MKKIVYFLGIIVFLVLIAGVVKFNFINDDVYLPDGKGGYVNEYGKKGVFDSDREDDLCDENGKRYKTAKEAKAAGLSDAEFGATYCPEYKMHPSWDKNHDGINDCYDDNSCAKDIDYMSPRK